MPESVAFPSVDWFVALAAEMSEQTDAFRQFGPIDCSMVVKVDWPGGSELIEVSFESFEVKSIRRLVRLDRATPDHFVIEAPLPAWREMIENIRENGVPDLQHTLNYLTFPDDPMQVSGPDQLQIDTFYRYNQSLQQFFNGASSVETVFEQ
jgi:hypothetical protein